MIYLILGVVLMTLVAFGTYSGWIAPPSARQAEAPAVITDAIDSAKEAKDLIEQKSRDVAGEKTTETTETPVTSGLALDLSNQGLTKVSGDVFLRTNLVSLDISHNKLTGALQAEVRHLSNLRTLDMSDNQFTGVPAEVGQLSKLEVLDLSNNQLTGLPYELGNLSNLKVLDLRGNNYAKQDLDIIKAKLSASVVIKVD